MTGPNAQAGMKSAIETLAHGRCCWDPELDSRDLIAALDTIGYLVVPKWHKDGDQCIGRDCINPEHFEDEK